MEQQQKPFSKFETPLATIISSRHSHSLRSCSHQLKQPIQQHTLHDTKQAKNENLQKTRARGYLNDSQTHLFVKVLSQYFESKIRIPRVRMGEQQEIETLINEEALLLAMFLRNERHFWKPRIECLTGNKVKEEILKKQNVRMDSIE